MLIVQGVFRSGTTLLFRTLRRDVDQQCYYEPLHPNLLDHVREAEGRHPDHEKSTLYSEYVPLENQLQTRYRPEFGITDAALNGNSAAPDLDSYFQLLTATSDQVVLQFNRAFWMTRWLRSTFPDSSFVHVVRDPRSVVWSQLTTRSGDRVRMDWPIVGRLLPFSSGNLNRLFSRYAYFGAYQLRDYFEKGLTLLKNATDRVMRDALSRLNAVQNEAPYTKALALWGAQVEACHRHGKAAFGSQYRVVRYEEFCQDPLRHVQSVYDLVGRPLPRSVRTYATDAVDASRVRRWDDVPTSARQFTEGIDRAQIADLMSEFGYDPS